MIRPAVRPLATLLALAGLATTAGAAPLRAQWSLGLSSGVTRFDPHFGDYQWNLQPHAAWGAQAGAGLGRYGLALRVWTASSTQHLDASASVTDPHVRTTTVDLAADARIVGFGGTSLLARASGGRVLIGYTPDQVTLTTAGGSTAVELAPVHAWSWGAGAAVRQEIVARWTATLSVERQMFAFDTAHRTGSAVELAREGFGNWNGRLELARLFGTR